jgi:multiple sugar transport system permease protein
MDNKTKRKLNQLFLWIAVAVILIAVLAPFLWLVISSISHKVDLTSVPLRFFPKKPTFENYLKIFYGGRGVTDAASQFGQCTINSLIVAFFVTLISMVAGSLAAYGLTRLDFRGKGFIGTSIILPQILPPIALIIPLFLIINGFGLVDTRLSLILTYISFILPLVIRLMMGHFASIPSSIEEAARIDGCTRIGALMRIVLPLSAPGIAATSIFAFIIAWNEFFFALIFASTQSSKTLSVLVEEFSSKFGSDFISMSTAGVLASLPPVILALIFQKFIIQGLTAGSVKG